MSGPSAWRGCSAVRVRGIHNIVLTETAFALEKGYEVPWADAVVALVSLLQKKNLRLLGLPKEETILAFPLACPSTRASCAYARL